MSNSVTKYEEIMSDREIMNSKNPKTTRIQSLNLEKLNNALNGGSSAVQDFEFEYPKLANEFKNIQQEQYELFARKMISYGRGNISLGGNLENKEDKQLSLTSIWIRMIDKMNRLKNMVVKNHTNPLEDESIEDTWRDISNYALIALLVGKDKW